MTLRGGAFRKLNVSPEQFGVSTEDAKLLEDAVEEATPPEEADEDGNEDGDIEAEEAEEKPKPKKKRGPRKKTFDENIETRLAGKFVNLVDILPPLPAKGMFDVSAIKESQYFFS